MIIFLDLPEVQVEGVDIAEEITLNLRTISPTASCPSCGTASSRIQSRYTRTLHDLPSIGRPIHLILRSDGFYRKTGPAFKRSLLNSFQISVILMRNAQNGSSKPSVRLDSK